MKKIDQNNQLQIESLLNECKGNLFEFLVAQSLSRRFKKEDVFLLSLPRDFRGRLQFYEETIRRNDSELLKNLPILAEAVSENLEQHALFKNKTNLSFTVIGKIVAVNANELWNETDIVVMEELPSGTLKKHFLSLKLTKDHSYTNTKSAGIKSFIEKYFSAFGAPSADYQSKLNMAVDESFYMMGHKLYGLIDQDFCGSFDARWSNAYTELPGELNSEMKKVVHDNYFRVALKVREFLGELFNSDAKKFYESLHALCGFGNPDIVQVSCFHQNALLKEILIKTQSDLFADDPSEITLKELAPGVGSFDVVFKKFVLQIRVKPMNKFTTAAYKINCSIKMKGKTDYA
ncbi:MAG: hypothetical protein H7336_05450 [Bacteriovorax sp.]|nr:hypothetical protein [Bacteriovorax sp.]